MFSDLIRLTRNSISDFNYLSMFFICELRAFSDRIHITSTLLCVFNQRESMAKIKNETISPLHEKQMHKCMNCTYPYAQNGCKEKREKKQYKKKSISRIRILYNATESISHIDTTRWNRLVFYVISYTNRIHQRFTEKNTRIKKKELNENQSNMQQKFENIIHSLSMKLKSVAMHIPIALSIFH